MNELIKNDFTHLKIHTQYSICEGAFRTSDLAKYCNSLDKFQLTNLQFKSFNSLDLEPIIMISIFGSIIRKGSKQYNKANTPLLITWANLVLSINDHSPEDLLPTATTMPAKAVSDTETSAKDNKIPKNE